MGGRKISTSAQELVGAGLDPREAAGVAPAESGPSVAPQPAIATDYVHTVHPDTGLDVVFVPGERLPDWAVVEETPIDDEPDPAPDYSALPLERLRALAAERGLDTTALKLRDDYQSALEKLDQVTPHDG